MLVIPGENYEEQELMEYLSARLEAYKLPKQIYEVTVLPKTFKGTILRKRSSENAGSVLMLFEK